MKCEHELLKPVPKFLQGVRILCFECGEYWIPPVESNHPALSRTIADYPLEFVTNEDN